MSTDIDADVNAIVGDFGLSRHVAPHLGEILPTWQWLAPQVIDPESDGYDHTADIYRLIN